MLISRYSTVAKAEKLIAQNKVKLEGIFESRIRFVVSPLGEKNTTHLVTCNRLTREEWKCDCKHFALDQTIHCSHMIACRLYVATINKNKYEYESIIEEERYDTSIN